MTAVAIIPARGGSKRIPGKNIRSFHGKPMIGYAIGTAIASGLFARIIVSTESEAVAEVALQCGAEVPFRRPIELADDFTGTGAVVNHAIRWLDAAGEVYDEVCCIYPTAPLLSPELLREAASRLRAAPERSYAFSVGAYRYPVYRALSLSAAGDIGMLFPEHAGTRSQDLPPVYHDAGQFYFGRRQAFLDGVPTFSAHSIPIEVPALRVIDIDTEEDWQLAEVYFEILRVRQIAPGGGA